jgi:hypothetical protein
MQNEVLEEEGEEHSVVSHFEIWNSSKEHLKPQCVRHRKLTNPTLRRPEKHTKNLNVICEENAILTNAKGST